MLLHVIRAAALRAAALGAVVGVASAAVTTPKTFVNQTTCNEKTYTYEELAGYGFVPNDARDQYGDTMGGFGSAIAMDRSRWRKNHDGSYSGLLYAIPDRGW
jgi:hypothetical protein